MVGRPRLERDDFKSISRFQLQQHPDGSISVIPKKQKGADGKPKADAGCTPLKRWEARVVYRDANGVTVRKRARGPVGVEDRYGDKAEAALKQELSKLAEARKTPARERVALMSELLEDRMQIVRADPDKSRRTLDSYNRVAKVLVGESGSCTPACKHLAGLRANEVTPADLDDILKDVVARHGRVTAVQGKTLLNLVGQRLVMARVWPANYVNEVKFTKRKRVVRSAAVMDADELRQLKGLHLAEARELLGKLATSDAPLPPMTGAKKDHSAGRTVGEFAQKVDLVDPITVALYLGLRRSELLGLLWSDYDRKERTLKVRHHVVRAGTPGGSRVNGRTTQLIHERGTKTESSERVIALPDAIVELFDRRRDEYMRGTRVLAREDASGREVPNVIFPNTVGQLRDPDSFGNQWRRVRGALGVPWMGLHAFRKSCATILDELGYSPRQIADILGHRHPDETTQTYIVQDRRPKHDVAAGLNAALSMPS